MRLCCKNRQPGGKTCRFDELHGQKSGLRADEISAWAVWTGQGTQQIYVGCLDVKCKAGPQAPEAATWLPLCL